MSSSVAKPGAAPACWTSRNYQRMRVVYCSHLVLTCLCTDGLACCGCAEDVQEALCWLCMCCPRVVTFAVSSLPLFTSPFPSPCTWDLLHECRTYSVSEMPWQCWICCAQSPQRVRSASDWELWTEVCKSGQGPFWLLWCLVNLGLTHSPQCLKLTPSSFKFSSEFSSSVLLLAIQVAKWWQCSYLLPSDFEEGSG